MPVLPRLTSVGAHSNSRCPRSQIHSNASLSKEAVPVMSSKFLGQHSYVVPTLRWSCGSGVGSEALLLLFGLIAFFLATSSSLHVKERALFRKQKGFNEEPMARIPEQEAGPSNKARGPPCLFSLQQVVEWISHQKKFSPQLRQNRSLSKLLLSQQHRWLCWLKLYKSFFLSFKAAVNKDGTYP